MTGSRLMSPLDVIPIPAAKIVTTIDDLRSWRNGDMAAMATALDKIHATVLDASTRKRQKNRERRSKKKGAEMAQLDVGDFVLYMNVWSISHSKLSAAITIAFQVCVRWRGLQDIEDSWEPAAKLLEDVPTEIKRYVRSNKSDAQVKAMATALGETQSLGGFVANLPFAEAMNPSQEGIQVFD
ncbi:hypothetical protein H257_12045 [Aphanomyces astaci]|uniref:Chromo domain-containing protein n=1 Tax=Aphanomyces astaci TaxID=112090 RepID=W4FZV8_APHAT|nr:hypothetical protein H257_12045 [Aphanomyces astaci]ETV73000.1 hypothetical protein H257_12045 [Aphanomyces astaci]|eukprot:XP_009837449.1 hypothetical protein H257_12045 [Aphanomyces astaci]